MADTRTYDSPKRDRQKAETRATILEAVVRVVLDDGVHAFTVGNVAKRAGVSSRTVYRHFDSRDALIEGLSDDLETRWAPPADLRKILHDRDAMRHALRTSYATFEAHSDAVETLVLLGMVLRKSSTQRVERAQMLAAAVRERRPDLEEDAVRAHATLLHQLLGGRMWLALTREAGLDHELAADTAIWSLYALLDDLDASKEDA